MSQSSTFSPAGTNFSRLLSNAAGFYRRWFAAETIYNPRALDEIGLGFLARR